MPVVTLQCTNASLDNGSGVQEYCRVYGRLYTSAGPTGTLTMRASGAAIIWRTSSYVETTVAGQVAAFTPPIPVWFTVEISAEDESLIYYLSARHKESASPRFLSAVNASVATFGTVWTDGEYFGIKENVFCSGVDVTETDGFVAQPLRYVSIIQNSEWGSPQLATMPTGLTAATGTERRSLMIMPVEAVAVESARLWMHATGSNGSYGSGAHVRRLNNGRLEPAIPLTSGSNTGATWARYQQVPSFLWGSAGCSDIATDYHPSPVAAVAVNSVKFWEFDITTLYNAAVADGAPELGLRITSATLQINTGVSFASPYNTNNDFRPYLVIIPAAASMQYQKAVGVAASAVVSAVADRLTDAVQVFVRAVASVVFRPRGGA